MTTCSLNQKCSLVAILLVLGLAAAGDVSAQAWSGSGRIRGSVVDSEGNPVSGAKVYFKMLSDPDIGPPPFVTDKKGAYAFLGLKGGQWRVHAEAEGYRPNKDVLAEVYSSGVSDPIVLTLEKLPEEDLKALARWEANQFLKDGDELRKKGEYAAARAKYETAMQELQPADHPTVLAAMAGTYLSESKVAEAKTLLERSLAIDPNHVGSLKAMLAIVASEGDVATAETMLTRVPGTDEIDANTLINIGMSHYNKGAADKARPFLDRCVATHPDHPLARYFRGLVLLNVGANAEAAADFEKFIELAPNAPEVAQAKEFLGYLKPSAK